MEKHGVILAAAILAVAVPAVGATLEGRCKGGKNEAAGKLAACLGKAEKGLSATGDADAYAVAVAACIERFQRKWQRLDELAAVGPVDCPGDGGEIQSFIAACSEAVSSAIQGGALPLNPIACDSELATCASSLSSCEIALADAESCGNGVSNVGEDCDQASLNDATCVNLGFAGGVLACGGDCSFDTSGCYLERFVDNGDGTIADRQTGLSWEKKVSRDGTPNLGNLHDADNSYFWAGLCEPGSGDVYCQPGASSEANCLAGVEGDSRGCSQCTSGACVPENINSGLAGSAWDFVEALNTSSFGGFQDWRLPTVSELATILLLDGSAPATFSAFHGASCSTSCTDLANPSCSCTATSAGYWTRTTYAANNEIAWAVSFAPSIGSSSTKGANLRVRAVRGGN